MDNVSIFRGIIYGYVIISAMIVVWEVRKGKHALALGFAALAAAVALNSSVFEFMLITHGLGLRWDTLFTEWLRTANAGFMALVLTGLIVILERIKESG